MFSERRNECLTAAQEQQVLRQLKKHDRVGSEREVVIDSTAGLKLKLWISQGVFGSDIMSSSIYSARFLLQQPHLFQEKRVLDMGCGAGTMGLVAALNGARTITFADVSKRAIEDVKRNIKMHSITNAHVCQSNLFESIPSTTFDLIIFNHPFFSGDPNNIFVDYDLSLRQSMLASPSLVPRFLRAASDYLHLGGRLMMPFWEFAGKSNNPKTHIENSPFRIESEHAIVATEGTQLGEFSMYLLMNNRFYTPSKIRQHILLEPRVLL